MSSELNTLILPLRLGVSRQRVSLDYSVRGPIWKRSKDRCFLRPISLTFLPLIWRVLKRIHTLEVRTAAQVKGGIHGLVSYEKKSF
ncbi:hypothetical protein CsatA_022347 [Cannabis sativa]